MAPRPVLVVDPVSPMGETLSPTLAGAEFKTAPNVRLLFRAIEEPVAASYLKLLD
jgi:hypothetical protein